MSTETGSAPAGNPPSDGGNVPAPSWTEGLDAELKGFAELKGWDTPEKALTSYRNLEKFQGLPPERLAKIPDQADTAGWAEFNKRFGWVAPDNAEDYKLAVPEGGDDSLAKHMAAKFKEIGVPAEMARKIVEANNAYLGERSKADDDSLVAANAAEMTKLKSEWGGEYDKLAQLADRAQHEFAQKAGVSPEHMELMRDAMGPLLFGKLWAEIGSAMGEARYVSDDTSQPSPQTPDAARARLQQLGQDREWFKRFEAGGVAERQEFARLQSIVANASIQR